MKFSIIIPVYNVEKYIKKCLESIDKQTYQNFEVIIVDDGSTDKSKEIIKKFINKKDKYKYYFKKNGGQSEARNYGLKYATGDYLLFIDSDDYINQDLLQKLKKEIETCELDVIKFGCNIVENNNIKELYKANFSNSHINDVLKIILKDALIDSPCIYCYKLSFWQKHNFKFVKGRLHEDFGLIPLILMNAKKISSIPYVGYNYAIRDNSTMNSNTKDKLLKKFNDYLYFFKVNIPIIKSCQNINDYNKKLLMSFYANGVIQKLQTLDKKLVKELKKEVKINKVYDYLIADTLGRKIKKICYKYFNNLFIKGK